MIYLHVPGLPVGKGRPRIFRGRAVTPAATRDAEARIVQHWLDAGSPTAEGPLSVEVLLCHERPAGHFKKDGSLSAEGLRHPYPHRTKPDVDNAGKLVLDALNGHAWKDDVAVVTLNVVRRWSDAAGTWIRAGSLNHPSLEGARHG